MFNKSPVEVYKQVKDLTSYDNVYLIWNSKVYNAWVMKITKHLAQIYVYDLNKELILNITNYQNNSSISFEDKILVLNKKDICDYL